MRTLSKFLVLLWKNLLLKRRHWFMSILEVVVPVLLFIVLAVIKTQMPSETHYRLKNLTISTYQASDLVSKTLSITDKYGGATKTSKMLCGGSERWNQWKMEKFNTSLLYTSPEGQKDQADRIMETVSQFVNAVCEERDYWHREGTPIKFEFVDSEDEVVEEFRKSRLNLDLGQGSTLVIGGIIFKSLLQEPNNNLEYVFRYGLNDGEMQEALTEKMYDNMIFSGKYVSENQDTWDSGDDWCSEGRDTGSDWKRNCVESKYRTFVSLQQMVDFAYIDGATDSSLLPPNWDKSKFCQSDMVVYGDQAMPYPEKYRAQMDFFDFIRLALTPILVVISFAFTVPLVLKRVVEEKQQGVKELMKMMGLPNWLHWTGWFVITILTTIITIIVMVIVLVVGDIYSKTDPFILFISLFLYSLNTICFNFAQSTLLSNPNLAVALGIMLHFGTWVPASFITTANYFIWSKATKMAIALVPNMGATFIFMIIVLKEDEAGAMSWKEVNTPINASDNLTLLDIWISSLLSCLIFLIFLWYMDNVRPGKFGVAKKLWFPFQKSYWVGEKIGTGVSREKEDIRDKKMFEPEPVKERGVEVNGLRKVFQGRTEVIAVNNVTFNAYKSEITALLGHNGAGKTTTMSMLTGLFSPTEGTARINGFNITTDLDSARERMGLCPQHNMLFPSLTVLEHLIFFGMLKGISMAEAKKEGVFFIQRLNLEDKKDRPSSSLSGGMKRKLHLSMALIGPSEILMLDEPTSGMDPEARRAMWDVLQEMKKTRTIMLTTHFMEEADVLGDRIAIMADGEVKCCGSPMFLKSNLGSGYTLTITKASATSTMEILNLVKKHVPTATLKNENSLECIIELDIHTSEVLPGLATELDKSKDDIGFSSFGFSKTTIEDVFLRVGEGRDRHADRHMETEGNMYQELEVSHHRKVKGQMLVVNHFKGLFMKRIMANLRMWKTYIALTLLSLVIIVSLGYIVNHMPGINDPTPTPLSMSNFAEYDSQNQFIIASDNNLSEKFLASVEKQASGIGTSIKKEANLTSFLSEEANHDMIHYAKTYIVGITKQPAPHYKFCANSPGGQPKEMITMQYNPVPYHSRPLATNLLSNFLLNYHNGTGKIITTSYPMVYSTVLSSDGIQVEQEFSIASMQYMTIMTISMSLLLGIFIIFPLKERVTNAKQVQLMAGVSPIVFWITNFVWDFLIYLVIAMIYSIVIYLMDTRLTFTQNGGFGGFISLIIILGFAGIPWAYILNFMFKSAPSAYSIMIICAIVTGIVGPLATIFLRLFYSPCDTCVDLALISDIIRYILSWIGPFFTFGHGVNMLVEIQEKNAFCANAMTTSKLKALCETLNRINITEQMKTTVACCDSRWGVPDEFVMCDKPEYNIPCRPTLSFWTWDVANGFNIDLIILAISSIIFWTLLVCIEMNIVKLLWVKTQEMFYGSSVSETNHEDEDVTYEKETVFNNHINNNVMKVINLTKKFGKFEAVRGLTFGVRHKECFGLLGVNGAGKTTTFRMLTGDEVMTSGESFIGNVSLGSKRSEYLQSIGYCPQFDSIIEVLTGREMLTLFARIRGLRSQEDVINKEINKLASFVDLTQYLERPCGQYSGGNKRKLNLALALIGRPQVMLLDEPTTGVDPAARRKMWETINNIRRSGTSVILTSHSMEECEALCDRLAIMVAGRFQCLGGPQHIKAKFGKGFQIVVKLDLQPSLESAGKERKGESLDEISRGIVDQLKSTVINKFAACSVTDEHLDYLHFHVGDPNTPWGQLFRNMESIKTENPVVQDYSVSETTLEQIFLGFARGENKDMQTQFTVL